LAGPTGSARAPREYSIHLEIMDIFNSLLPRQRLGKQMMLCRGATAAKGRLHYHCSTGGTAARLHNWPTWPVHVAGLEYVWLAHPSYSHRRADRTNNAKDFSGRGGSGN